MLDVKSGRSGKKKLSCFIEIFELHFYGVKLHKKSQNIVETLQNCTNKLS